MPKIASSSELDAAKKFQFVGGDLSLDFCNTMGGKRGHIAREYLHSCLEYLGWCHQAGLLDRAQAEQSLKRAAAEPAEAASALTRAVELREAIFRILAACIARRPPSRADLARLNAELSQALGRLHLTAPSRHDGFGWEWTIHRGALDGPLGPIAHAAARLLTNPHALAHVNMCSGDNCGWLFLDSSKNHSRRWCDMRDCGNRAKIRRHRLKHRLGG